MYLGIGMGGTVTVSAGGLDAVYLCTTNSQECRDVYAILLASKLSGKPVGLHFDKDGGVSFSCTDRSVFPAWSFPTKPFYFIGF